MNDDRSEIAKLERELQFKKNRLKETEANCSHEWGPTVNEPEEYQEPVFSHYEAHGSDPEPVYNYTKKTRNRWSRTCNKCGKKEFSYTQKPVKYEPNFDR